MTDSVTLAIGFIAGTFVIIILFISGADVSDSAKKSIVKSCETSGQFMHNHVTYDCTRQSRGND